MSEAGPAVRSDRSTIRVPEPAARLLPQPTYHTRTWLLWLLAAGLAALLTGSPGNPLYLTLIILAARGVDAAAVAFEQATMPAGDADSRRHGWSGFLRLGLVLAGLSALFNGLAAHQGATVLAQLPDEWPIVGGPLTLEALVYGALAGLALVTVLIVAGTFNTGADTYALLRAIPAFLSQAGLVTAIGLAYVPQTIVRVREIHEAQQLRGHRFRGPGSLLPLAVPLLAGGLERAIQLAEAMESRGFSRSAPAGDARERATAGRGVRLLLALGTAGVGLGAFLMLYFRQAPAGGGALLGAGLLALGGALFRLGRLSRHTRYRREIWRRRDSLVTAPLLVSCGGTLGIWASHAGWWAYTPYPALYWPPFEPWIGLSLALLAAPALPLLGLVRAAREPDPAASDAVTAAAEKEARC